MEKCQPAVVASELPKLPLHESTLYCDVQAFDKVINLAFTAMLIIYGIVAGLGYYYFGDAASTLITDDLARNSPFTGHSVSKCIPYFAYLWGLSSVCVIHRKLEFWSNFLLFFSAGIVTRLHRRQTGGLVHSSERLYDLPMPHPSHPGKIIGACIPSQSFQAVLPSLKLGSQTLQCPWLMLEVLTIWCHCRT